MNTYPLSTDYDLMVKLMKEGHRLVCFADYDFSDGTSPSRDVARTIFEDRAGSLHFYAISSRGVCYAGGMPMTEEKFKRDCTRMKVEFIPPLPAK